MIASEKSAVYALQDVSSVKIVAKMAAGKGIYISLDPSL